jgi:hypothetical protein
MEKQPRMNAEKRGSRQEFRQHDRRIGTLGMKSGPSRDPVETKHSSIRVYLRSSAATLFFFAPGEEIEDL